MSMIINPYRGSPPRVRGGVMPRWAQGHDRRGFTPACAGEEHDSLPGALHGTGSPPVCGEEAVRPLVSSRWGTWVHPHVCGEEWSAWQPGQGGGVGFTPHACQGRRPTALHRGAEGALGSPHVCGEELRPWML